MAQPTPIDPKSGLPPPPAPKVIGENTATPTGADILNRVKKLDVSQVQDKQPINSASGYINQLGDKNFAFKQPTALPTNITSPGGFGRIDEPEEAAKQRSRGDYGSDVDASDFDADQAPELNPGDDVNKNLGTEGAIRPEIQAQIVQKNTEKLQAQKQARLIEESSTSQGSIDPSTSPEDAEQQGQRSNIPRGKATLIGKDGKVVTNKLALGVNNIKQAAINSASQNEMVQKAQQIRAGIDKAKKVSNLIKMGKAAGGAPGLASIVGAGGTILFWIFIAALIFAMIFALARVFEKAKEFGGGGNEVFFSGKSSPESCTRSVIEAGYGIAMSQAGLTNDFDRVGVGPEPIRSTTLDAMNLYAKFAAITSQATTNLIRTGAVEDRDLESPIVFKANPYGSGVVLPKTPLADEPVNNTSLIAKYLNVPLDNTNQKDPDENTPSTNLTNYDSDTMNTRIEGAGAILEPSPSIFSYTPAGITINYFDVSTSGSVLRGTDKKIGAGPVQVTNATGGVVTPPNITRQALFSESYGAQVDQFLSTGAPIVTTPTIPSGIGPDADPDAPKPAPVTASVQPPSGAADDRLLDGTAVSFYSFTLGFKLSVSFATLKIPFVSDFFEWLFGLILDAVKINIVQVPVYSSTFYQVTNTGSFGSTLLSNFDAFSANPFSKYTTHKVLKDQNQAAGDGFNTYIKPAVNGATQTQPTLAEYQQTNPGATQAQYEKFLRDDYASKNPPSEVTIPTDANGKPISDNPRNNPETKTSTEDAIRESPQVKKYAEAGAALASERTTSPTPVFVQAWQNKPQLTALQSALSTVTDSLLRAGNTPRSVQGFNLLVSVNLSIDVGPVPPFVTILPGLPTISGQFAKKSISNAPNGQEFLDLYNRVGIAVLKASSDPAWDNVSSNSFASGVLSNGNAVAAGMEKWVGDCKSARYDTTVVAGGVSSAFSQENGLNSCKLYQKNITASEYDGLTAAQKTLYGSNNPLFATNDRYLPNALVDGSLNTTYLTQEERGRLTTLGIKDRRDYYESIIISEAKAQGIDPKDGVSDELDRAKLAYILATAAYETNFDFRQNSREFQDLDFTRFSEINPAKFAELGDVFSAFSKDEPIGSNGFFDKLGRSIDTAIIKPLGDAFTPVAGPTGGVSRDNDIFIQLLNSVAGINEAYGPLGKAASDAALGVLNSGISSITNLIPNVDVKADLQSLMKKWYTQSEGGALFFDDSTIDYVFDSNNNGALYYGRGFALGATRGKGVYKQLERQLGKPLVAQPNQLRQDPSTMAQALIASMKSGMYTGYRLDDFFNSTRADILNARKIIDNNFVPINTISLQDPNFIAKDATPFTSTTIRETALTQSRSPTRNPEQTSPDKLILERYRYYYSKLGSAPLSYFSAAKTACNSTPDGRIFKNNLTASACLREGFNYLNTSDEKNKYQTYGFTIKANNGTPIYPLFGGKIFFSNFATAQKPTAGSSSSSGSSSSQISEQDLLQRRKLGDPITGNQLSVVSNVDGKKYIIRYTNLDGTKLSSKGFAPGTSINKDDVIGYVSNSGPAKNGKLPETQVRVEVLEYFGAGLDKKTEEIYNDAKTTGNLINPLFVMDTALTSKANNTLPLCSPESVNTNLYNSPKYYVSIPPKGVAPVPGSPGVSIETWLTLR